MRRRFLLPPFRVVRFINLLRDFLPPVVRDFFVLFLRDFLPTTRNPPPLGLLVSGVSSSSVGRCSSASARPSAHPCASQHSCERTVDDPASGARGLAARWAPGGCRERRGRGVTRGECERAVPRERRATGISERRGLHHYYITKENKISLKLSFFPSHLFQKPHMFPFRSLVELHLLIIYSRS